MAVIQDRGPFRSGGNGSVFAKAAKIQASIQKPGARPASNPLLNPNQPLSGKALQQAASSLTNAQITGPLAEIAKALAAQDNQTRGTMKLAGSTFNQLGQQAQQGVTDQQQNATSLNNALQQIAGNTNSQLQGIGQNATQSLLSHSPQGDGGLATPALAGLAADIAKQQGIAAQQQGNQQAFGANQGGNYTGLAASQLGTNAVAGTDALKSIAQSGQVKDQPFTQKIADLQAQRGALQATNLGKLRQEEINNRITEQGLGLKQQDIASTNARAAATIQGENNRSAASINAANQRSANTLAGLSARQQAQIAAQAKQGALNRQSRQAIAAANKAATKAGKPPVYTPTGQRTLTPQEQQRQFGYVDTIRTLIPQIQAPLSASEAKALDKAGYSFQTGQKLDEGTIRHLLAAGVASGTKYNPALVDAAYALAGYGYLTPKQITGLNKLGLIVGTRYKRSSGAQNVATGVGGAAQGVAQGVGNVFGA